MMTINHGIYHPPSSILLGGATVLLSMLVSFRLPFCSVSVFRLISALYANFPGFYANLSHAPILLPVSGQSCQLEIEKSIKWFLVLILACLKRSVTGVSFISA